MGTRVKERGGKEGRLWEGEAGADGGRETQKPGGGVSK